MQFFHTFHLFLFLFIYFEKTYWKDSYNKMLIIFILKKKKEKNITKQRIWNEFVQLNCLNVRNTLVKIRIAKVIDIYHPS